MTELVLDGLKAKQRKTWASGDYGAVAALIQPIAEYLVQAADLSAGLRVLDVAAGTGNASIAAARCGCRVTSTDFVPALLARGRERAIRHRHIGLGKARRVVDPHMVESGGLRVAGVRLQDHRVARPQAEAEIYFLAGGHSCLHAGPWTESRSTI